MYLAVCQIRSAQLAGSGLPPTPEATVLREDGRTLSLYLYPCPWEPPRASSATTGAASFTPTALETTSGAVVLVGTRCLYPTHVGTTALPPNV